MLQNLLYSLIVKLFVTELTGPHKEVVFIKELLICWFLPNYDSIFCLDIDPFGIMSSTYAKDTDSGGPEIKKSKSNETTTLFYLVVGLFLRTYRETRKSN